MNRSESITKISAAINAAQKLMGNATKGASNPFFKSKFADLNAVREACIPVLNDHGIAVLQPTTVQDGKAYVETTLLHESGEFLASLTEIIANKQNDAQAHGSGVSYARRYGLQSFLCIGAEDDDGEKAHGRGAQTTKQTAPTLATPLKTTGVSEMVNVATSLATAGAVEEKRPPPVSPKKGGFGVKAPAKVEVKTTSSEDGWT